MQTEMSSSPAGDLSFACWQKEKYFNRFSNKSQQKITKNELFWPH